MERKGFAFFALYEKDLLVAFETVLGVLFTPTFPCSGPQVDRL
jgi:hypothetical protein